MPSARHLAPLLLLICGCATLARTQALNASRRTACDGGDASACLALAGTLHAREAPGPAGRPPFMPLSVAERELMIDDYERACVGGLLDGCRGVLVAIGGSGEPAQVERASRARGRACELGAASSCRDQFEQTQDPAALRALAGRICELDEDTCVTAMTRLARVDDPGAVELARLVCDRRSPAACGRVAAVVSRPARDELLDHACTLGAGDACDLLAGLASDATQAKALYARGCQLGSVAACKHLGELESR